MPQTGEKTSEKLVGKEKSIGKEKTIGKEKPFEKTFSREKIVGGQKSVVGPRAKAKSKAKPRASPASATPAPKAYVPNKPGNGTCELLEGYKEDLEWFSGQDMEVINSNKCELQKCQRDVVGDLMGECSYGLSEHNPRRAAAFVGSEWKASWNDVAPSPYFKYFLEVLNEDISDIDTVVRQLDSVELSDKSETINDRFDNQNDVLSPYTECLLDSVNKVVNHEKCLHTVLSYFTKKSQSKTPSIDGKNRSDDDLSRPADGFTNDRLVHFCNQLEQNRREISMELQKRRSVFPAIYNAQSSDINNDSKLSDSVGWALHKTSVSPPKSTFIRRLFRHYSSTYPHRRIHKFSEANPNKNDKTSSGLESPFDYYLPPTSWMKINEKEISDGAVSVSVDKSDRRLYFGRFSQFWGRPVQATYEKTLFSNEWKSFIQRMRGYLQPLFVNMNTRDNNCTESNLSSMSSGGKKRFQFGNSSFQRNKIDHDHGISSDSVSHLLIFEDGDSDFSEDEIAGKQNKKIRRSYNPLLEKLKNSKRGHREELIERVCHNGYGLENFVQRIGGGFGHFLCQWESKKVRRLTKGQLRLSSASLSDECGTPLHSSSEDSDVNLKDDQSKYRGLMRRRRNHSAEPQNENSKNPLRRAVPPGSTTPSTRKRSIAVARQSESWINFSRKRRCIGLDSRSDSSPLSNVPLGWMGKGTDFAGHEFQLTGVDTSEFNRRFGGSKKYQNKLSKCRKRIVDTREYFIVFDEKNSKATIYNAAICNVFFTKSAKQVHSDFCWKLFWNNILTGRLHRRLTDKYLRYLNFKKHNETTYSWPLELDAYEKMQDQMYEFQPFLHSKYIRGRSHSFVQRRSLDMIALPNFSTPIRVVQEEFNEFVENGGLQASQNLRCMGITEFCSLQQFLLRAMSLLNSPQVEGSVKCILPQMTSNMSLDTLKETVAQNRSLIESNIQRCGYNRFIMSLFSFSPIWSYSWTSVHTQLKDHIDSNYNKFLFEYYARYILTFLSRYDAIRSDIHYRITEADEAAKPGKM